MTISNGISRHVRNVIAAMAKRPQIEGLYREVLDEMEQTNNYYKEYGKAIAIVRTVYQVPVTGITGIKTEDAEDIESGYLRPEVAALSRYADALGLGLDEFLDKVASNVGALKAFEGI